MSKYARWPPIAISRSKPGALELMQRVVDRCQRHALAGTHGLLVQHFSRHVPVAGTEQQRRQRHALPRRPQAGPPKQFARRQLPSRGARQVFPNSRKLIDIVRADTARQFVSQPSNYLAMQVYPASRCELQRQAWQAAGRAPGTQAFGRLGGCDRKRQLAADGAWACAAKHGRGWDQRAMAERPDSYEYEDLLTCGRGELFGPGNAQLPLPPMLMFDRISSITDSGGAHGKGQIVAELKVAGNPALDWFFACHFKGDPVMPGCLGLDALWQLTGFFLGWLGAPGKGRALGVGEVKLTGMVVPTIKTRAVRGRLEAGDPAQAEARHRRRRDEGRWSGDLSGDRPARWACSQRASSQRRCERHMAPQRTAGIECEATRQCEARCCNETRGRDRHGHRLLDRQQHPGSAGLAAGGQVRDRARRQICRAWLSLPGARRRESRMGSR